jgi:hypothetical protein
MVLEYITDVMDRLRALLGVAKEAGTPCSGTDAAEQGRCSSPAVDDLPMDQRKRWVVKSLPGNTIRLCSSATMDPKRLVKPISGPTS